MSAIAATSSASSYSAVVQLLSDGLSGTAAANGIPQSGQAANSNSSGTSSGGPTDSVTLSDHAKAVLAQAQKDQVLANQLQSFVQSNRSASGTSNNSISGQSNQSSSTPSQAADQVMQEFDRLTGQTTAASTAQQTDGSNSAASSASGWSSVFPGVFVPTKSMSTSVTLGGFTVSVQSDPSRLYSEVAVSGNGVSAFSKHFWPSAMAFGGSGSPPGINVSIGANPNNSAEDIVTITQNQATATSASASSSTGSSAAVAAVSAQSSSMTFVINYATGEITAAQSSESVSARSASQTLGG
jgi:hypothetical protein